MTAEPTPRQVSLARRLADQLDYALDVLDRMDAPSPYRPPMTDEAHGAIWTDLMTRIDNPTETDR